MKRTALLASLMLSTGCVTWQSNLEAKQAELDAAKADAAKADAEAKARDEAAKKRDQDYQAQVKELQAQVAKTEKELAGSQVANTELSDKLKKLGQDVSKLSAEKGQITESLALAQRQMEALRKQEEQERQRAALYHKLVEKLKAMIDSGKLAVQVRSGKMLVKLQNDILFQAGSASVKKEGQDVLAQLAQVLTTVPDRNFQVTGHTDNDPIHSEKFASNWELSTQRAINVVNLLTAAGLDPKHVSAAGYADNDPVVANDSPENKQKNRRIEIVVQPNIDELPRFDEAAPASP